MNRENGFPDGIIPVAETARERRHPATFKAGVLTELIEQGWTEHLDFIRQSVPPVTYD